MVHILKALVEDYAYSPQANCRKGGLLALAAAAVALADRKGVCTPAICLAAMTSVKLRARGGDPYIFQ